MIDWDKLEEHLKTHELGDPESIVHELAHAYDCIKDKAFKGIGTQKDVSNLLCAKYKVIPSSYKDPPGSKEWASARVWKYNLNEVLTTAVTFLVLQPFGLTNLAQMIRFMHGNMGGTKFGSQPKETINQTLIDYLSDAKVIKIANKIREFCVQFKKD